MEKRRRSMWLGSVLAAAAALGWVVAWSLDLSATRVAFKPFPVLLVLGVLAEAPATRWRTLLRPALLLCAFGDVLLELPTDNLLPALVPYGLGQLLLMGGLYDRERRLRPARLVAPLLTAAALFILLWAPMGAVRGPLLLYSVLVVGTVWRALCAWERPGGRWVSAAALVFLASDALLGIDRFLTPLPLGWLLVVGTYWLAVALFVGAAFRMPTPNVT